MNKSSTIYKAPPDAGSLILGRTLPSLLDEACDRHPNARALNQWQSRFWQPLSNLDFRRRAEEVALGLRDLGLQPGDRVALLMHNGISFCVADMACLLAGLVNVPIDLTQTIENMLFILQHSGAKALVISDEALLAQVKPYLKQAPLMQQLIVVDLPANWVRWRGELTLADVQARGQAKWSPEAVEQLKGAIAPQQLATILYIASETTQPKGVMLSHENITANVLAAFTSYPALTKGPAERALLFLPLTHIFARVFLYGHLAWGHSLYFSDPNRLVKHLKSVQPTVVITVPRLLEKIYERILDRGRRLQGWQGWGFAGALKLARGYDLERSPQGVTALLYGLADRLVLSQWRTIFGDHLKALIVGGAALSAELARVFSAAGVPVLQGYGLTETSGVLYYNRGTYNRAGTVGVPIAGVEMTLAEDQEILIRAPFVMQGYYQDEAATARVLTPAGWLHTGDLGAISPDGFLTITGVKKAQFKLSTGKYVSLLPLEQALLRSPWVTQAIAVGANQKFCGMLIFPNLERLRSLAQELNLETKSTDWLQHPQILALYQTLIDDANCHLPYWSTVRKFRLLMADLTLANGLLKEDGSLNRPFVLQTFATDIAALYQGGGDTTKSPEPAPAEPEDSPIPTASCPTYARSLTHY